MHVELHNIQKFNTNEQLQEEKNLHDIAICRSFHIMI